MDHAAILADLARVRAVFQLRAITAALGLNPAEHPLASHPHGHKAGSVLSPPHFSPTSAEALHDHVEQ